MRDGQKNRDEIGGHTKPRPYDLNNPEEIRRLFQELAGYMRVSLRHGTDTEGRQFALDALRAVNSPHAEHPIIRAVNSHEELVAALKKAIEIADEARGVWDAAPSTMRPGKLLIALSGKAPGYRSDIDTIHATLAKAEAV